MKRLRGYVFSRSFMGERAPQHVQNLVCRSYCQQRGMEFLLSATEYAMPNSSLMLKNILSDMLTIDGIVAYSMFQMPQDAGERQRIVSRILQDQKELHFAVERLVITDVASAERLETIWRVRQVMDSSSQIKL